MQDERNFSEKPKGYFPVLENDFLRGIEVVKFDLTDFINSQDQLKKIGNELFEDLFDSEVSFSSDGYYLYVRKTDYEVFKEISSKHLKNYINSLEGKFLSIDEKPSS